MKKKLFSILVTPLLAVTSAFAQTREVQIYKGGEIIKSFSISEIDSIKVFSPSPQDYSEYAVDLGLSVKWASMNVGASKPEDYGDYFAWGEITPKTTYDWSTYTLCKGSSTTMTKYCNKNSYGTVDNKTKLELTDDAAYANWGGTWRMPTLDELYEVNNECTWTSTTQNSVKGYLVTGPNGNSIFLPVAGSYGGTGLNKVGSNGYYWSSSINTSNASNAMGLYFYNGYRSGFNSGRCSGRTIRPVTE